MFTCGPNFFVAVSLILPGGGGSGGGGNTGTEALGLDVVFSGQPYLQASVGLDTSGLDLAFNGTPFFV